MPSPSGTATQVKQMFDGRRGAAQKEREKRIVNPLVNRKVGVDQ